jgi:hypothetical protein
MRSIAIFAARESADELTRTVHAALRAVPLTGSTILELLVNGNEALAAAMADRLSTLSRADSTDVRVWFVAFGDKAHTWNWYINEVWAGQDFVYFVDGYARLRSDAVTLLERGMCANRDALVGTGLPSTGRRVRHLREAMLRERGIHGNFYCLRKAAIEGLKDRDFRLPIGVYRTDPTMGAAIAFGLDPQNRDWNPGKYIHIEQEATWDTDTKSLVDLGALRSQFKRVLRQQQGALENAAVRHFYADSGAPIGALPRDVQGLLRTWIERMQQQGKAPALGWLQRMALRRALATVDRRLATRPARLLYESQTHS